ncbi:MAG: Glutathione-regulated potassium-efflux system protein kefC [Pseudomonadota bacterium]
MQSITLGQVALFLAAAALAAPLAKSLKIGTVLGYLIAGILIGPSGLGKIPGIGISDFYSAASVLHFAEFGVVLLLFLIGLELRPQRLWSMRKAIAGAGGAQVVGTGIALALIAVLFGLQWPQALFVGLALALSSTAFALQVMEENGELTQRHGRLGFSILLFQDLAAIPLLATAGLFAVHQVGTQAAASGSPWLAALQAMATIAAVVVVGRFVLDRLFELIARAKVKEALTATALLVVVVVVLVMHQAGLSASLGAFVAGAVLADSSYRHEIEADIKPFEGLLLGLFFTAIGMSLDLGIVAANPLLIIALVIGLVVVKAIFLYFIGRWQGLEARPARRLALSISQGGEFAFVLFTTGVLAGVLLKNEAAFLTVLVTLSMVATPAALALENWLTPKRAAVLPAFDTPPETDGHVIIAGFGRFGQIVSRVLRGKKVPFTALDIDPEHIAEVARFGAKTYFGDASRLDILEAAQASKARAFVLAIDDVEASVATAQTVRKHFPQLKIYARARNREHVHRLMDLGVEVIRRETFSSAMEVTEELLLGLGYSSAQTRATLERFREVDEKRLVDDYAVKSDEQKLQARARRSAEELQEILAQDEAERAIAEGRASSARQAGSAGPGVSGNLRNRAAAEPAKD